METKLFLSALVLPFTSLKAKKSFSLRRDISQQLLKLSIKIIFLLGPIGLYSQQRVQYDNGTTKTQYGFSAKLILDITYKMKNFSNIRLGVAAGIGYNFYQENFTSLNLEYSAALGGLGTYNNGNTSYFVISPNFCQSLARNSFHYTRDRLIDNQPQYYFTDLINPPLQNQFQSSVSIGANFIRFVNKRQVSKWQRGAHVGVKIDDGQLVYNNDGGTILKLWGDREDRYFTGCGFLHIHLKDNLALNDFGISFYKFSGYNKMSFEVGDELLYSSADYKDLDQNFFNRGFWSFQVGNSRYGDVFIRYNNPRNVREVQNFIHYNMGFGYHQSLTDSFYSYGGSINYYQTNISEK